MLRAIKNNDRINDFKWIFTQNNKRTQINYINLAHNVHESKNSCYKFIFGRPKLMIKAFCTWLSVCTVFLSFQIFFLPDFCTKFSSCFLLAKTSIWQRKNRVKAKKAINYPFLTFKCNLLCVCVQNILCAPVVWLI